MKLFLSVTFIQFIIFTGISQSENVKSYIKLDSINSEFLGEYRKVVTYLPKDYDSVKKYPIIYAPDGQIILESDYKSLLDSLISQKKIPPLVLIGAYSNETVVGKNLTLRNYEYVKKSRNEPQYGELYDKHLSFFLYELKEYLDNKLKIQRNTN